MFCILCTPTAQFKELLEIFSQSAWSDTCLYSSLYLPKHQWFLPLSKRKRYFSSITHHQHVQMFSRKNVYVGTKVFNKTMLKERKLILLLPQHMVDGGHKGAGRREGQAVLGTSTAYHFQMKSVHEFPLLSQSLTWVKIRENTWG